MGAVPSTPRFTGAVRQETAEYLIGAFIGDKSYPLTSDYWQKLLLHPLYLHWSTDRVHEACRLFAKNNHNTRHLAKILVHLSWCLQECVSASDVPSLSFMKALNAVYISSIFLKYLIENANTDNFEELYISLNESEEIPHNLSTDQRIEHLVVHSVFSFVGKVDVSTNSFLLHYELLNFMLVAMSTQLLSGPSPGPSDIHPFIDAAMLQESSLVNMVVQKLLHNYITRPRFPAKSLSYQIFAEGNQPGVLQRVGSVAANLVLLPLSYFASSSAEASKSPLADSSLNILLILTHYRKCLNVDPGKDESDYSISDPLPKEETCFFENPYCVALDNARDTEFDRVDIEGTAQNGPLVRLPFASLFDTLGMCLADETSVLLLYSLVHGNSDFLEYVLVRTDLDTLLMPLLETLYNAPRRAPNQIYMVLIILLILSQDSSFNASIHKLMLQSVPWYKERVLHQTSLGSLMVIILTRIINYNLSKLRDVYLHTNCLATLANMAPHVHRLSAYASQRLVSLFDMLSRKYNKLAEMKNDKMSFSNGESIGDNLPEDSSAELHIYTDFLRIVLEILNAILTYALPRNPEVVYAILHRQEVFHPFKSHPRFNELLDNLFTVLDFFNSRMDAQNIVGEWSVEKVLQIIIVNCRSWRGEGMKMFTQMRFTYEQESHPEEFFIPYVWQLVLSRSGLDFSPSSINLFPVDLPVEDGFAGSDASKLQNGELDGSRHVGIWVE
ncbi:dymeclin [Ipomoea triloba]|uniref:dymeclin n=1 Tax=Ipomoea triloba TaxID=35885 RepID=UPI00125E4327|nr:dymeclin [Ipomoea triloba]